MTLESIEKLRDYMEQHDPVNDKSDEMIRAATLDALEDFVDDIQREVDECYMKIPVDADGVPIHVGDRLEWCSNEIEAKGICEDSVWFEPNGGEQEWRCIWSNTTRHVKPDPVKELLRDFVDEIVMVPDASCWDKCDEYAAKIREAVSER